jgi:hypothetical protein
MVTAVKPNGLGDLVDDLVTPHVKLGFQTEGTKVLGARLATLGAEGAAVAMAVAAVVFKALMASAAVAPAGLDISQGQIVCNPSGMSSFSAVMSVLSARIGMIRWLRLD